MAVTKAAEAFRTISEVADELGVPKHVLRFWEGRFPQLRPMKRGGGRRFYRPEDVEMLKGIRRLLHDEGYTIKGVQKLIRDSGIDFVKTRWRTSSGRGGGMAAPVAARSGIMSARGDEAAPATAASRRARAGGLAKSDVKLLQLALDELSRCRALIGKAAR